MSSPTSPKSNDDASQRYRKPRADVFTVLLVIALLGIILGCVVLYMVMKDYEFKFKDGPRVTFFQRTSTDAPTPPGHLSL